MSNFKVWSGGTRKDGYFITKGVQEVQDDFLLSLGISLKSKWSLSAYFRTIDRNPFDNFLPDCIAAYQLVVSKKLKNYLEENAVDDRLEFLQVRIITHDDTIENYFILNPLDIIDCIDIDASGVDWNPICPEEIMGCDMLQIDESKIPEGKKLFRLKHWPKIKLISNNFAEQLIAYGFTGLVFEDTLEYMGI